MNVAESMTDPGPVPMEVTELNASVGVGALNVLDMSRVLNVADVRWPMTAHCGCGRNCGDHLHKADSTTV